jgi:hypothetical protein
MVVDRDGDGADEALAIDGTSRCRNGLVAPHGQERQGCARKLASLALHTGGEGWTRTGVTSFQTTSDFPSLLDSVVRQV